VLLDATFSQLRYYFNIRKIIFSFVFSFVPGRARALGRDALSQPRYYVHNKIILISFSFLIVLRRAHDLGRDS
jgi:hypothetical protein